VVRSLRKPPVGRLLLWIRNRGGKSGEAGLVFPRHLPVLLRRRGSGPGVANGLAAAPVVFLGRGGFSLCSRGFLFSVSRSIPLRPAVHLAVRRRLPPGAGPVLRGQYAGRVLRICAGDGDGCSRAGRRKGVRSAEVAARSRRYSPRPGACAVLFSDRDGELPARARRHNLARASPASVVPQPASGRWGSCGGRTARPPAARVAAAELPGGLCPSLLVHRRLVYGGSGSDLFSPARKLGPPVGVRGIPPRPPPVRRGVQDASLRRARRRARDR